jgi:hypothetical protein|tara:strand:- start:103 stop:252 length:150 start_codon:yes stop_codon:yes gene_type:complete
MEELVKEADKIVADEIEERRKKREAEAESVEAKATEGGEVEEGEEVNSA